MSDPSCNTTSNDPPCTYVKGTKEKEAIDDATAGMLVVLALFILPAAPRFWPFKRSIYQLLDFFLKTANIFVQFSDPGVQVGPSPGLLDWPTIQDRMPWALVLLLGGGFALAKACDVSGMNLCSKGCFEVYQQS